MHSVATFDAQIGLSNAIRDKQITMVRLYKAFGRRMAISHPSFSFMLLYKQFTTSFFPAHFGSHHQLHQLFPLSTLLPRWSAPEHAV